MSDTTTQSAETLRLETVLADIIDMGEGMVRHATQRPDTQLMNVDAILPSIAIPDSANPQNVIARVGYTDDSMQHERLVRLHPESNAYGFSEINVQYGISTEGISIIDDGTVVFVTDEWGSTAYHFRKNPDDSFELIDHDGHHVTLITDDGIRFVSHVKSQLLSMLQTDR